MNFDGKSLSWHVQDGVIELALHQPPCNEIGTSMLEELEQFARALEPLSKTASALIVYSRQPAGFCAGADLRELYAAALTRTTEERVKGVREFLERIHW